MVNVKFHQHGKNTEREGETGFGQIDRVGIYYENIIHNWILGTKKMYSCAWQGHKFNNLFIHMRSSFILPSYLTLDKPSKV